MIHAEPGRLADLRYVVLDEVHYLQDPYRGGVWEEVILGAPLNVTLVCLSATVANADQLAAWISEVRGATGVVIESAPAGRAQEPVRGGGPLRGASPPAAHLRRWPAEPGGDPARQPDGAAGSGRRGGVATVPGGGGGAGPGGRSRLARAPLYRPRRVEVVDRLAAEGCCRRSTSCSHGAGCDESVRQCLDDGLRLTTPEERRRIRAIVESTSIRSPTTISRVLGYGLFAAGLEAGVAAHHAGMVPPFREAVEACSPRPSSRSSSPPRRSLSASTCRRDRSSSRR